MNNSKNKTRKKASAAFPWIIVIGSFLFTFLFFFLLLIFWTENNFGVGLSVQQILVNAFSPYYGMDTKLCFSLSQRALYAMGTGIIFCLYFSGFFIRWFLSKKKCFSEMDPKERKDAIHCRLAPFYRRNKILVCLLTLFLFIADCAIMEQKFGIINFLYSGVQMSGIFDHYHVPNKKDIIAPDQKRNLVLIISESLEETYSRKEIFGEDLLAELGTWRDRGESVQNWISVGGTNWTMASLISVLYGIPRRFVWERKDFGDKSAFQVLRTARSIFHVLNEQGYEIVFAEGSSLAFSGRDNLFRSFPWMKTLSYENLYSEKEYQDFIKKNDPYSWGIHDKIVLDYAQKEIGAPCRRGSSVCACRSVARYAWNGRISRSGSGAQVRGFSRRCPRTIPYDLEVCPDRVRYSRQ
ncbi:MAG: hypothetical protein Q4G69_06305 [Planctomycetia bacterium]|nr:hypothetical protein [Planctomycetia bacterium]